MSGLKTFRCSKPHKRASKERDECLCVCQRERERERIEGGREQPQECGIFVASDRLLCRLTQYASEINDTVGYVVLQTCVSSRFIQSENKRKFSSYRHDANMRLDTEEKFQGIMAFDSYLIIRIKF